jgi:hypothetical protein
LNRRDLLKTFGVISAAVANVKSDETTFEKLTDYTSKPLVPRTFQPFTMDVVKARLYSALVVDDTFVEYMRTDGETDTFADYKFDCRLKDRHQFFKYSLGTPNPYDTPWVKPGGTITYADTNMNQDCRLNAPEAFMIQRVGLVFSPKCDPVSRSTFIENYSVAVWMGCKHFFRCPIAECFSIGEPVNKQFHELPEKGSVELLPLPLIVENQIPFFAEIQGNPFRSGYLKCWVVYEGLHARGIQ